MPYEVASTSVNIFFDDQEVDDEIPDTPVDDDDKDDDIPDDPVEQANVGLIVGVVLGSVAFIIIVGLVVYKVKSSASGMKIGDQDTASFQYGKKPTD